MKIILKEDVQNLGNRDDVVVVKNGYALNYLIPQGFAIMATPSALKVHNENMRQKSHKEAKLRADAEALAAKLEGLQVTVATKVSSTGKVFGSVNNIQIAEVLAAKGYQIDRRNIIIAGEDKLQEVGLYDAVVKCYKDIKANIKVEVVAE